MREREEERALGASRTIGGGQERRRISARAGGLDELVSVHRADGNIRALVDSAPRYRTLFTLARGGMGRIDVAQRREAGFERVVAVKRLHDPFAYDQELVAMMLDEARVAGTIRHANVVSVLDVGRDEEGLFLVMDLIEGQSLHQLLRTVAAEGLLPLQITLRILRQIAAGLHAAHESRDARGEPLQVVHRDVSPQNVMIGYDGLVRLTDFGVARALGASTATAAGVVKGKLRYMSPEQLTFGAIDRRTDLYALGVVAFEIIAGRHPYEGTWEDVARATIAGDTPDLGDECPELPSDLVELVFRLLAREPSLRPRDAAEVEKVLDGILADVVAEEGPMEVAAFVARHFAQEREELHARIRAALNEPEITSPTTPPIVEVEPVITVVDVPPKRGRWIAPVVLAVGLLAAGLALAWNARAPESPSVGEVGVAEGREAQAVAPEDRGSDEAEGSVVQSTEGEGTVDEGTVEGSERSVEGTVNAEGAEPSREEASENGAGSKVRRARPRARVGAWTWEHESR